MTVSSTSITSTPVVGNGVWTVASFSFTCLDQGDLRVVRTESAVSTDLVLDTDYSVTLNANQSVSPGGSITMLLGAPTSGQTIQIIGNAAYEQATVLQTGGRFNATVIERALDYLALQIKQLVAWVSAGVRAPIGETVELMPAAASRADRLLGFNSYGNPIAVVPTAGDASALAIDLASTNSNAKGAGQIGFNPALSYVGRTLGAAVFDDPANFLWFCTEAQRAAIKAKTYADDHTSILSTISALIGSRPIYFPAGGYKIGAFVLTVAAQSIVGDGIGATIIRHSDPTTHLFTVQAADVQFRDLELHGAATSASNSKFAIFTDSGVAAPRMRIERVKISGQDASHGFANGVKWDTNADYGFMGGCYVERLWGSGSGYGTALLTGAAVGAKVMSNTMIGASGRGRHMVYFSAGANKCSAIDNTAIGTGFEAFTTFSQGGQPACTDILFAFNTADGCSVDNAILEGGSISAFGHTNRVKIVHNTIINSKSCGILVDGNGVTDTKNTEIVGNTVFDSDYIGISVYAGVGGNLCENTVYESGHASAGTYPNIRFQADASGVGVASSNWLVTGNKSSGSTYARSAFQLNATAPVPTNFKVDGNKFDVCNVIDVEILGSNWCAIDGRIRYSTTYDPASIANGAALTSTYTVTGAAVGDVVTVTHTSDTDGCALYGRVSATDTVKVTIVNNSGGSKDIGTGTLYISVWKSIP